MKKAIELDYRQQHDLLHNPKAHMIIEYGENKVLLGAGRKNGTASVWGFYSDGSLRHIAEFSCGSEANIYAEHKAKHTRICVILVNPETISEYKSIFKN